MMRLTRYETAVNHLRAHGPMTAPVLAAQLGWPLNIAKVALHRALGIALVEKVGSEPAGQCATRWVYGATPIPEWKPRWPDQQVAA